MSWTSQIPEGALQVCATLRSTGHSAYIVGGAMRDLLMGREPHDWDIATSARPDVTVSMFPKVILTGIQHGTVTVMMSDGSYEVTVFRGEGAYSDGRRPDTIRFLDNVVDDLSRRDFTINAIAGDPLTGEIVDPFGGERDIADRILRCVGNPDARFGEDGLRIMRAVRFASVLEFDLDPTTAEAIPRHLSTFQKVAVERKFEELAKLLIKSPNPSVGLMLMVSTGLMAALIPELQALVGLEQNRYHQYNAFMHTMHAVDEVAPRLDLRLAAMLHDIGKVVVRTWRKERWTFYDHDIESAKLADSWLKRMKVSTDLCEKVVSFVANHHIQYKPDWSDATIRKLISKVGPCNIHDQLELYRADITAHGETPYNKGHVNEVYELQERVTEILAENPALDVCNLAVTGEDIMRVLKIKPSRVVGQMKKALLEMVLERPELNNRETLEALIPEVARRM